MLNTKQMFRYQFLYETSADFKIYTQNAQDHCSPSTLEHTTRNTHTRAVF